MDSEQERPGDAPDQPLSSPSLGPPAKKGPGIFACLFTGAWVSLLVMSVLYGPGNALGALALAVICTGGVSLIAILPLCWLVGWIVLLAWRGISGPRGVPSVS